MQNREKQIEGKHELSESIYMSGYGLLRKDCDDIAEQLYSEGYRKQEWISVGKPPEVYRDEYGELIPFLVCCKGTVYPFRAVYDGTNWGDGIGRLKVTHWMPLPEPPKKGGAE